MCSLTHVIVESQTECEWHFVLVIPRLRALASVLYVNLDLILKIT